MARVTLDGAAMTDWAAFHDASQAVFGFPEFYGRSMDAWIDCLSYLRDDDGMSAIRLGPDEVLDIEIANSAAWRAAQPDMLEEVLYCIAGINERYEDYGEPPALRVHLR
ncbi:MAG: barstar family protein [Herminiimonas sp.]|nr:barstar family protein [Herminiimonas sp.]